jgi:hypothetical protein
MPNTKVTGDLIASSTITATNLADSSVTAAKLNSITTDSISEGTNLFYTDARVGTYLSGNGYDTATNIIATITDSAPTTLDTLNELAAALGDDPNFATTVTNSIATKLPLAGGTISGNLTVSGSLTGTLATAAQTNVTSVGTLSSLAVSGNLTVDTNTLFVDASTNRVGIGTSNPSDLFEVKGGNAVLNATNAGNHVLMFKLNGTEVGQIYQGSDNINVFAGSGNYLRLSAGGSERMRIDSTGNVGIGTSSPNIRGSSIALTIDSSNSGIELSSSGTVQGFLSGSTNGLAIGGIGADGIKFTTASSGSATERMRIDSTGNVGIGTSSPTAKLSVIGVNGSISIGGSGYTISPSDMLIGKYSSTRGYIQVPSSGQFEIWDNGTSEIARFKNNKEVVFLGNVIKASGSFRIDHPLKPDTHYLVHSFAESPQANNIYRGKVQLIDGKATVNLDEVSTMTEGTFAALNRDIHTYTSNESDWDAVRGSVEGNILTIECQNAQSTATVSWLVIGERQDKHMYDTSWTDENGKVIVEPEKTQEEINDLKAQLNG